MEWLWDPRDDELKRVFADWVQKLSRRLVPDEVELVPVETLEGVKMTLEERVAEWPRQLLREGREQGMREGIEKGIEQGCLSTNGRCCVARRHPGSERRPRNAFQGCWPTSRIRSIWPTWAGGWCVARQEMSFSPA